ncbi:MAG: oxidoreductase-like protein [Lysobacterales bacterium CG17_big_fil_post_rev_8_21_14_2_50_64_11]|nr:MAG: oxidoreductase-like protein [Xanthomonadales bacterium CG17_big_fil_post_rev_8_21_14_2_50_64_11]
MTTQKPTPPVEPLPGDCCGEGCPRCVYDIHEEALVRYQQALAAWQAENGEGSGAQSMRAG